MSEARVISYCVSRCAPGGKQTSGWEPAFRFHKELLLLLLLLIVLLQSKEDVIMSAVIRTAGIGGGTLLSRLLKITKVSGEPAAQTPTVSSSWWLYPRVSF